MAPTRIRERLGELDGSVDPGTYAAALFYVRGDPENYDACRRDVRSRTDRRRR